MKIYMMQIFLFKNTSIIMQLFKIFTFLLISLDLLSVKFWLFIYYKISHKNN